MNKAHSPFRTVGGIVAASCSVTLLLAATLATAHDDDSFARHKPPRGLWLAGDTHVHTDHSSDGSLPRQQSGQRLPGNLPVGDQIAQAERTGLDFLPLTDHRTYDQHWDPQYGSEKLILIPGEEANGSPHAIVLGASDEIVDGANPADSAAFRHIQQSIWDTHAQDGIWSVAHPDSGETDAGGVPNANANVVGMDLVEVFNVSANPDAQVAYAENRWNKGFRFGVAAASDDHFRELWDIAGPGRPTTWVFAEDRSQRAILDALRAGRTTVSRGPGGPFVTIEADVNGGHDAEAMGGDEVSARAGRDLTLRVHVKNGLGATLYMYRSPGRSAGPLAKFTPTSADQTFTLTSKIAAGASWYRAEVRSPGDASGINADPTLPDQLRAATSPIFVTTGDDAVPQPEIAIPPPSTDRDHAKRAISGGAYSGFSDAASADGVVHVVAETHDEGRTFIAYTRIDEDGDQHDFENLTPASDSARFPRIAASGRNVWIAWQDSGNDPLQRTSTIFARHSIDGGRHWGPAIRVSGETERANHPAIALVKGDRPVIAWAERVNGAFDIRAQILGLDRDPKDLSATGKTLDPGTSLDARSPRFPASLFPSVAVTRNGDIAVAWQDNRFDPDPLWTGHTPPAGQPASGGTDPDNWDIMVSTRKAGAVDWQAPVSVSASPAASDRHASIVADRDGRYVVAWDTRELRSSGVNTSLLSSQSTDGGRTWSPAISIALAPAAMSQRPKLALDRNGDVRAIWYDSRSSDWRWQIFASSLTGTGWTDATQLTRVENSTWPAISGDAVTFTSDRHSPRTQRDSRHEVMMVKIH